MRILYVTTISSTMDFFKSLIKELIDDGNIVDIATNESEKPVSDCFKEWGCKIVQIPTSRSPFSLGNVQAIKQIRRVAENYDIVHCHTPLASAATRIACNRLRKKGLKVIYTAHGFHFYKGAPLKNWLIYYPVEWICAYWTDVLITINKEDFERAKKHLHAKKVEYVPGVGIDIEKFANTKVDRKQKRKELGIPEDVFLILSVGELNENKNHKAIIEAISKNNDKSIHYAIAGKGELESFLKDFAKKCGVEKNIHLLGYRTDVAELYKTADLYALPSKREGLNVSLMEAMASGTNCIVSRIRGNIDIVEPKQTFEPTNSDSIVYAIKNSLGSICNYLDIYNFDSKQINKKTKSIYYET